MNKNPIRVGIVGVHPEKGWAAIAHIPALRLLPDAYEITTLSHHDPTMIRVVFRSVASVPLTLANRVSKPLRTASGTGGSRGIGAGIGGRLNPQELLMKADALSLPDRVSSLYPFYLAAAAALRGWCKAWNVGHRKMLRAKRERRESLRLCEMDDRELADIGLSRSDLSRLFCSRPSRQERRVQDAIALGVALGVCYPGHATPRERVS